MVQISGARDVNLGLKMEHFYFLIKQSKNKPKQ